MISAKRRALGRGLVAAAVALAGAAAVGAATHQVTIAAQPAVTPWGGQTTLSGSAAGARAGDLVELEAKRCDRPLFETYGEPHVGAGGSWSFTAVAPATTTFRARWRGATSDTVTVRVRPGITVRQITSRRFLVGVVAVQHFRGRRASFQRFDRRRGWLQVKSFVLDEGGATNGITVWAAARVRVAVPRGTLVRVVLPRSQTGRCYLAGYSNMIRT